MRLHIHEGAAQNAIAIYPWLYGNSGFAITASPKIAKCQCDPRTQRVMRGLLIPSIESSEQSSKSARNIRRVDLFFSGPNPPRTSEISGCAIRYLNKPRLQGESTVSAKCLYMIPTFRRRRHKRDSETPSSLFVFPVVKDSSYATNRSYVHVVSV